MWKEAQELLEAAGATCKTLMTTHPGHAIEEIAGLDLEAYACIVALGGDGSVHEILQVPLTPHRSHPSSLPPLL